jgi:cell division protein FtsQ
VINDGENRPDKNRHSGKRNQRRNQHLLEVKVRSRRASELKYLRMIGWLARGVIAAALLIFATWGGREVLRRFLWENGDFLIKELDVRTDGPLPRNEIITMAGALEGVNIFTVNLSEAHRHLSECPQVEEVEIRRELPNRLSIRIRERKPVAWLADTDKGEAPNTDNAFLLDGDGNLMRPGIVASSAHSLPVIYGSPIRDLRPGTRVENEGVRNALDLLRLNRGSTRFDVTSIDIAHDYCIEVTDRRRMKATFGLYQIDAQLARLNRILDHVEMNRRDLATINLMVERNIPVTYLPLDAPTSAPAESAAPAAPPADAGSRPKPPPSGNPPATKPARKDPAKSSAPKATASKPSPKTASKPAPQPAADKPVMRAEPVEPPDEKRPAKRGFSIPNPFMKRHG